MEFEITLYTASLDKTLEKAKSDWLSKVARSLKSVNDTGDMII